MSDFNFRKTAEKRRKGETGSSKTGLFLGRNASFARLFIKTVVNIRTVLSSKLSLNLRTVRKQGSEQEGQLDQ